MKGRKSPNLSGQDGTIAAGLLAAGAGILCVVKQHFDIFGAALGTDGMLWGMAAKHMQSGADVRVQPGFPLLISLLERLDGVSVVDAGLGSSAIAFCLLPTLVFAVSRLLGGARLWSGLAGLASVAFPPIWLFGVQVQPDAVSMLLLVLVIPVVRWFQAAPQHALRLAGLVVFCAVIFHFREHLQMAAFLSCGLMVLATGPSWQRLARPFLVLGLLLLAPSLLIGTATSPLDAPWNARITLLAEGNKTAEQTLGDWAIRFPDLAEEHEAAHRADDANRLRKIHFQHSVTVASSGWIFVLVGLLCVPLLARRMRLAALVPLCSVLPVLAMYSEARHVYLVLPAACAVIGAGLSQRKWWFENPNGVALCGSRLVLGAGLLAVVPLHHDLIVSAHDELSRQAIRARTEKAIAAAFCPHFGPDDVIVVSTAITNPAWLYCPRPQTTLRSGRVYGVDWRAWVISTVDPGTPWEAVDGVSFEMIVYTVRGKAIPEVYQAYRMRPDLAWADRPCADAALVGRLQYEGSSRDIKPIPLAPECPRWINATAEEIALQPLIEPPSRKPRLKLQ
jgi:hypothetical protein